MALKTDMIRQLHELSPIPVAAADKDFSVVWANKCALEHYPQLSVPGGLASLLSLEQLLSARNSAVQNGGAFSVLLAAMPHFAASFTPVDEGYMVIIGFADPNTSSPLQPESIGFLTGLISSKLRAPLSGIFSGITEVSQTGSLMQNERLCELADRMNQYGYGLLRFSIDFNAYLKYILGSQDMNFSLIDLSAYLKSLTDAVSLLTAAAGISFGAELPKSPVLISADENALSHALLHIISNCCRYTREGNQISLSLTVHDTHALITISDKGLGIAPDILSRVCEPFFTCDPLGEHAFGEGLGLAIAQNTVMRHGGTLAVTSREGEGSSVAVSLPLNSDRTLSLKEPAPAADILRDRFSMAHIILSDSCGCPKP